MRKKTKKSYSAKLKFQIVLEALTSDKEDAEIARAYDVHPVSLSKWKRQFIVELPRFGCCCRIGREVSVVGKMAVCSLNTSSVWTDSEFGNSIALVEYLGLVYQARD